MLTLATPAAVNDLEILTQAARTMLLPGLPQATERRILTGPTFVGSFDVPADADIIVGDLLLEMKTQIGPKKQDGSRYMPLNRVTLDQLLGYLLLDYTDQYQIRQIGIYQARYAHLAVWPVQTLLDELAGTETDLAALRRGFKEAVREQMSSSSERTHGPSIR